MDKSSVRRRPNNSAAGQQQQQMPTSTSMPTPTLHTKRTAGRSKCVGKASASKDRANPVLAMVQPTNNSNNNNSNSHSRCSSARETARNALPTITRIGFGRSVTSSAPASAAPSGSGGRRGCPATPPAHLKPMAEAHKQLELMLARIERGSDLMPAAPRRRKLLSAKLARSHGERPLPPVPTVTPLSSARQRRLEGGMEDGVGVAAAGVGVGMGMGVGAGAAHPIEYKLATTMTMAGGTTTTTTTMSTIVSGKAPRMVPLAQNPQRLTPEKRLALLKLLTRVEQRDQDMVQVLLSEINAAGGDGGPTDGGMCHTHQRLPLSLNSADSPYGDSYCVLGAGSGYRRERQRTEDEPRLRDMRTMQGAPNESNQFLEDVLREETQMMDLIDDEIFRQQQAAMSPVQRQRQQQTMDERVELDKQKQLVGEWRVRHHQKRLKREKQHVAAQLLRKATKPRQVLRISNAPFESEPEFQMPQLPKETVHIVPMPESWGRRIQRMKEEEEEEEQQGEEEQYHNEAEDDDEYGPVNSHSGEGDNNGLPSPGAATNGVNVELNDLFMQRLSFQAQCGRSNLYNNCQLFSNITNTLSDELVNSMDEELRRNLTDYPQQLADQQQ